MPKNDAECTTNKVTEVTWWEEWEEAAGEIPRELVDCGWRCNHCNEDLGDYLTRTTGESHYLDDYYFTPEFNYCPNCGKSLREGSVYDGK